jgi:hypothetical protein
MSQQEASETAQSMLMLGALRPPYPSAESTARLVGQLMPRVAARRPVKERRSPVRTLALCGFAVIAIFATAFAASPALRASLTKWFATNSVGYVTDITFVDAHHGWLRQPVAFGDEKRWSHVDGGAPTVLMVGRRNRQDEPNSSLRSKAFMGPVRRRLLDRGTAARDSDPERRHGHVGRRQDLASAAAGSGRGGSCPGLQRRGLAGHRRRVRPLPGRRKQRPPHDRWRPSLEADSGGSPAAIAD